MGIAVVSIICIALIVVGGMTMSQGFLSSADSTGLGVAAIGVRNGEIMRTELSPLTVDISGGGGTLEVELRNSGQVKLASFVKWDVIVKYYDKDDTYHIKWLPYVDGTLSDNEWRVKGIYLSAENMTAEVFEPGILSPGEEMVIEAQLSPSVKNNTSGDVVVSTPNGVTSSISFTR